MDKDGYCYSTKNMEGYLQDLSLPPTASLEEARTTYHRLAEQLHPDNGYAPKLGPDNPSRSHPTSIINDAWRAIQNHFFDVQHTPPNKHRLDQYHFNPEHLQLAKEDQEYIREQPRLKRARTLKDAEESPPGILEEHEGLRKGNKGNVFEDEATVTREDGLDIISGAPVFKDTIFMRSIILTPKASLFKTPDKGVSGLHKAGAGCAGFRGGCDIQGEHCVP
jgi:hypothetical protein